MEQFDIPNISVAAARADSSRVCYLVMPRGLTEDVTAFIDGAARKYGCNMVVLHGMNWNDDLTPWPAEGVFKEKKPFGGKSADFLSRLIGEYIPAAERALGLDGRTPERYLIGTSLSGLFAVWASLQTSLFCGIGSISGSLWYDGFEDWFCGQAATCTHISTAQMKVHLSLGNRERNAKEQRMRCIESSTASIAEALRQHGAEVDFQIFEGTHFSPIIPRLEMALESLVAQQ